MMGALTNLLNPRIGSNVFVVTAAIHQYGEGQRCNAVSEVLYRGQGGAVKLQ
ncbi:hypothetical protein [Mangrovibacter phragmitis]|uniref:hypothetical protein n=1 Tax=Mangrovibacter phragmitis TaxID=1691903 RepID=UPI0035144125